MKRKLLKSSLKPTAELGPSPKTIAKATKVHPTITTDAMYAQDIAPFQAGCDVLVAEMARALPRWMDKAAHLSAGARAGLFLRTMRNAAGLTQNDLGIKAQIRQSDISDLENSSSSKGPTFDVIARVADACGFNITFEAKVTAKPKRSASTIGAPILKRRRSQHAAGRGVRTFVMDEDGVLSEFEGVSPSLKKHGTVIVDDAAGRAYKVSVASPGARIAIEEAEGNLTAAVQAQSLVE